MPLRELFMDTLAYVAYFRTRCALQPAPYDQVRSQIVQLVHAADQAASGYAPEDYDLARFAVSSWVDETMMNCAWQGAAAWQREPLQLRLYQTRNAGELFFERLNTLGMHQNEVREVYYLCLCLGFMGRYSKPGDRILLDQLKTSHLKVLSGGVTALPDFKQHGLLPQAYPAGEAAVRQPKTGARGRMAGIALAALPAAVLGVLFLIYTFVLNNLSQSLLNITAP